MTKLANKDVQRVARDLVELSRRDLIKETVIEGPRFAAIELRFDMKLGYMYISQGLAKTHWRDQHNPNLGLQIAFGRALKSMAYKLVKEFGSALAVEEELAEIVPIFTSEEDLPDLEYQHPKNSTGITPANIYEEDKVFGV